VAFRMMDGIAREGVGRENEQGLLHETVVIAG
jgi:hypothetical protein